MAGQRFFAFPLLRRAAMLRLSVDANLCFFPETAKHCRAFGHCRRDKGSYGARKRGFPAIGIGPVRHYCNVGEINFIDDAINFIDGVINFADVAKIANGLSSGAGMAAVPWLVARKGRATAAAPWP